MLSRFKESCVRPKNGDEFDETLKTGRIDDQKKARNQLKDQETLLISLECAKFVISYRVENILDDRIAEETEEEETKEEERKFDTPMSQTPEKKR